MNDTLFVIKLPVDVVGLGKTRHLRNGELVTPQIVSLRIACFEGVPGVYVYYCDGQGVELNDLYFDDLRSAIEHIEWEFGIKVPNDAKSQ